MLHERSGAVASKSQHLLGKAADVHIPGFGSAASSAAGSRMKPGGVGFYPQDGFVHVDTARVRAW